MALIRLDSRTFLLFSLELIPGISIEYFVKGTLVAQEKEFLEAAGGGGDLDMS